jgi:sialate O-acetylesterase
MIGDWRRKWFERTDGSTDAMFPFGQVQIAPFHNNDWPLGYPDVRWHQTYEYGYTPNPMLENVFTAVSIDLPDFKSPIGA